MDEQRLVTKGWRDRCAFIPLSLMSGHKSSNRTPFMQDNSISSWHLNCENINVGSVCESPPSPAVITASHYYITTPTEARPTGLLRDVDFPLPPCQGETSLIKSVINVHLPMTFPNRKRNAHINVYKNKLPRRKSPTH